MSADLIIRCAAFFHSFVHQQGRPRLTEARLHPFRLDLGRRRSDRTAVPATDRSPVGTPWATGGDPAAAEATFTSGDPITVHHVPQRCVGGSCTRNIQIGCEAEVNGDQID